VTDRAVIGAARIAAAAELDLIRIRRIRWSLLAEFALSIETTEGDTGEALVLRWFRKGCTPI
jgi:hypothetical protein